MKKYSCVLMVLVFIISLWNVTFADTSDLNFSDLTPDHWSYPYVKYMIEEDIISGFQDGTFRPDAPLSRAAFATLLYKTFHLEPLNPPVNFEDLPISHWAYPYVQGSVPFLTYYEFDTGIFFYPDEYSVREDVAIAMVIASGNGSLYTADYTVLDQFVDRDDISPELREFVALAVQTGLMNGSDGHFNPQRPLTRAEACTVLAKYILDISDEIPIENGTMNIIAYK